MDSENYGIEEETFFTKLKNNIIELIEFTAIVGAILIVIRFFAAEPHKVSGNSMLPNFHNGDYIITNKLSLRFGPPERSQVIILQNPRNPNEDFIKRVIALPNEHIKVSEGKVYINNQELQEPYLPSGLKTQGGAFLGENEEITIPDNQYFVMGDNRGGSSDSREWGPIKLNLIIGEALVRYWPPQTFAVIRPNNPSN